MFDKLHAKVVSLLWRLKPTAKLPEKQWSHSFVVDRKQWNRGEEFGQSKLKRKSDGKRDILGFYLASLGVPEEDLIEVGHPADLSRHTLEAHNLLNSWVVEPEDWTLPYCDSDCFSLIRYNDHQQLPVAKNSSVLKPVEPNEREALIRGVFELRDVKVEFIN